MMLSLRQISGQGEYVLVGGRVVAKVERKDKMEVAASGGRRRAGKQRLGEIRRRPKSESGRVARPVGSG